MGVRCSSIRELPSPASTPRFGTATPTSPAGPSTASTAPRAAPRDQPLAAVKMRTTSAFPLTLAEPNAADNVESRATGIDPGGILPNHSPMAGSGAERLTHVVRRLRARQPTGEIGRRRVGGRPETAWFQEHHQDRRTRVCSSCLGWASGPIPSYDQQRVDEYCLN